MENEKSKIGVVVVGVIILGLAAVGASYYMVQKNSSSIMQTHGVKVGPNGVEVDAPGMRVKTGDDGVNVDMNGLQVDTGKKGVNVNIGGMGVEGGDEQVQADDSAAEAMGEEVANTVNTVLVFDASGSMAEKINGVSRIDIAKKAVADYVGKLEDNVQLGVVAYGHKGNNTQAGKAASCSGIEEIYYMGQVDAPLITGKVNALIPNGWTPITDSLKKANDILQKSSSSGKKYIVLLSDGEETCGGDPVAYACGLKAAGVVVDVIGLDVSNVAANQLRAISDCAGGDYYSVKNTDDFGVVVNNMGVKVNTGNLRINVSGDKVDLDAGDLNIRTDSRGVKLDAGDVKIDTRGGGTPVLKIPGVTIPSY